jgi:hypothetical protein
MGVKFYVGGMRRMLVYNNFVLSLSVSCLAFCLNRKREKGVYLNYTFHFLLIYLQK